MEWGGAGVEWGGGAGVKWGGTGVKWGGAGLELGGAGMEWGGTGWSGEVLVWSREVLVWEVLVWSVGGICTGVRCGELLMWSIVVVWSVWRETECKGCKQNIACRAICGRLL